MHSARLEIRLPESLKADVKRTARKSKEDVSDFVRVALMAAVRNYPGPTPDDLKRFNEVRRDLSGAAHNLNQLTRLAHQTRLHGGIMPEIKTINATADRLEDMAREVSKIIRMWI